MAFAAGGCAPALAACVPRVQLGLRSSQHSLAATRQASMRKQQSWDVTVFARLSWRPGVGSEGLTARAPDALPCAPDDCLRALDVDERASLEARAR